MDDGSLNLSHHGNVELFEQHLLKDWMVEMGVRKVRNQSRLLEKTSESECIYRHGILFPTKGRDDQGWEEVWLSSPPVVTFMWKCLPEGHVCICEFGDQRTHLGWDINLEIICTIWYLKEWKCMRSTRERRDKGRWATQVPPAIRNLMSIPLSYPLSTLGRPPRPSQLGSAMGNRPQYS